MARHALRTQVKADNHQALELLGYPSEPKFSLSEVSISKSVAIIDTLTLPLPRKSKLPVVPAVRHPTAHRLTNRFRRPDP